MKNKAKAKVEVTFDMMPLIHAAMETADAARKMAASLLDPEDDCPDCRYVYSYRHEGCNTCAPYKELLEEFRPEVMRDE